MDVNSTKFLSQTIWLDINLVSFLTLDYSEGIPTRRKAFGRNAGPDAPRVLYYGHYDVHDLKIERLQRKLVRAQTTLAKLIEGKDAIEEAIEELKASSILEEGETVMSGEVWVWGHDMSVVPGETYRYRMLVQLANPFFGHKPSLYQRQHSLANLVVMAIQIVSSELHAAVIDGCGFESSQTPFSKT